MPQHIFELTQEPQHVELFGGKVFRLRNPGHVINGHNANRNVPVKYQLPLLGLTEGKVKSYRRTGLSGLDIGCGEGHLVDYLRQKGFDFEGLDKLERAEPYFMNQWITGIKGHGGIPRRDDTYDMVFAFQNATLNSSFSANTILRDQLEEPGFLSTEQKKKGGEILANAQYIIYEATRVLKPTGRFVIYPSLVRLEDIMGPMLEIAGISIDTEPVANRDAIAYLTWENGEDGAPLRVNRKESFLYRTVITKSR